MEFTLEKTSASMPRLRVVNKGRGIINPKANEFPYKQENMFISEFKVNGRKERKFVISIRLDGEGSEIGRFKLSQMDFNEDQLLELRNKIDELLNIQ
ncbi:hypothetical protein ACH6EH_07230 [Paenibacillus sp. JSM ZJ436]|uniref:hypothetical protein n=1 Tax=Paenibacillus sp. JSM ZJ436 TaxID=3376190 RepID=UPI003793EBE7